MKTKLLKIIKIVALLPILSLQISCGKKNKGGSAVAAPAYYMNNCQCMAANGQIMPSNYCPNGAVGGIGRYYMNGANCMNQQNQVVAITFCQQNNGGFGGGGGFGGYGGGGFGGFGGGQQCMGFYYMTTGYGYTSVYCSGFACSGYMLTNSIGQSVFCQ